MMIKARSFLAVGASFLSPACRRPSRRPGLLEIPAYTCSALSTKSRGRPSARRSWKNAFQDGRVKEAKRAQLDSSPMYRYVWAHLSLLARASDRLTPGQVQQFRDQLREERLSSAMERYPFLPGNPFVTVRDTHDLIRALHHGIRTRPPPISAAVSNEWMTRIEKDLRSQRLPSDGLVFGRILANYRDAGQISKALRLWEWLKEQDSSIADARTYGYALDLLSRSGSSLASLEELYLETLRKFPGGFVEYNLSHNAILPDRSGFADIPGAHLLPLQGMLHARLQHGDWRNGYLALDTAFRLYPTQMSPVIPARAMLERPPAEAYKILAMACRSGQRLPPNAVTTVMSGFCELQEHLRPSITNIHLSIAALTAWRVFLVAGGPKEPVHQNVAIKSLLKTLGHVKYREIEGLGRRTEEVAMDAVRQLLEVQLAAHLDPMASRWTTMISIGAEQGRAEIMEQGEAGLSAFGLELEPSALRTRLYAAGVLRQADRLEEHWTLLVESQTKPGSSEAGSTIDLGANDWRTLIRACARCDRLALAKEILERYSIDARTGRSRGDGEHSLSAAAISSLESARTLLDEIGHIPPVDVPTTADVSTREELESALSSLSQAVRGVIEAIAGQVDSDLYLNPIPDILGVTATEEGQKAYRDFYDDVTTDPVVEAARSSEGVASSRGEAGRRSMTTATGFPLAELRWENWKAINELLILAEMYEQGRGHGLEAEQASAGGQPSPPQSSSAATPPRSSGADGARPKYDAGVARRVFEAFVQRRGGLVDGEGFLRDLRRLRGLR